MKPPTNSIARGFVSVALLLTFLVFGGGSRLHAQQPFLEEIHSFTPPPQNPFTLLTGSDGNLYGTSVFGGSNGLARIFKVTPDGEVSTVASFTNADEVFPVSLVEGGDGKFYGTALIGMGFQATREGEIRPLFPATSSTSLARGVDGSIYGFDENSIFQVDASGNVSPIFGTTATRAVNFMPNTDGSFYRFAYDSLPFTGLISLYKIDPDHNETRIFDFADGTTSIKSVLGSDGSLYVAALSNGSLSSFYRITADGGVVLLYSNYMGPVSDLLQANDGNLYGVSYMAYRQEGGELFRLTPDGTYTPLYLFTNVVHGIIPENWYLSYHEKSLTQGTNGNLYCALMVTNPAAEGVIMEFTTEGTPVRTISLGHDSIFYGERSGYAVWSPLHLANDGCLYGTTASGGDNNFGTLFRINPDGTVTNLLQLNSENWMNSPIQGADDCLYAPGYVVVKLGPDGKVTRYPFIGHSNLPLVVGSDGNLFGAVESGWTPAERPTIFKATPNGRFTRLHTFKNRNIVVTSLLETSRGVFYGTASANSLSVDAKYMFFRLTRSGVYKTLAVLDRPTSRLILGPDDSFYALQQGPWWEPGRAIKIDTYGRVTVLANFEFPLSAGDPPPLFLANDGNFYGKTDAGGLNGSGFLFRLSLDGAVTNVLDFPFSVYDYSGGGLTQGVDGKLYGITAYGGISHKGSIYRVDLGLPPVILSTNIPAGIFNGSITVTNGGTEKIAGYFAFRLNIVKQFEGTVVFQKQPFHIRGKFDKGNRTSRVLKNTPTGPVILNMSLDRQGDSVTVQGQITRGIPIATLTGKRRQ